MSSLEQAAAQLLLAAETGHGRAEEMRELAAKLQVMTTQIEPIEQGA